MKSYSFGAVVRSALWGGLVGGAAGFTLGLLLAPEQGRIVRRRLVYQLQHMTSEVSAHLEHLVQQEPAPELRQAEEQMVAETQHRAEEIRQELDQLIGKMRRHSASR